jgi:hypothetical protein
MGEPIKWKKKIATLLWRMFDLQYGGSPGTKFRWMQGFADGYIQAYIDLGIADEKEVLAMIQNERKRFLDHLAEKESAQRKAA